MTRLQEMQAESGPRAAQGAQPFLVAYSGGMDSTVLLQALQQARRAQPRSIAIRAVHLNHQLQAAAADFEARCRGQCRAWRIPFQSIKLQIKQDKGLSLEAEARAARYAALAKLLRPGERLLTAHHADDQWETLLLALMRGAGPQGLAAMPATQPFAQGAHWRPLLTFTRSQLADYAASQDLQWIEDPSNQQPQFDRNYLRLEVLPVLRRRWPAAALTASRSASLCALMIKETQRAVQQDLELACDGTGLQVSVLNRWTDERQVRVLRAWVKSQLGKSPSQRQSQQLLTLLQARPDATPSLLLDGRLIRRAQGRLDCPPAPAAARSVPNDREPDASIRWSWRRQPRLVLPVGSELHLKSDALGEIDLSLLPDQFSIRWVQPGAPRGAGAQQRSLKKRFQSLGIPTWERAELPLIWAEGRSAKVQTLVAIADRWVAPRFRARAECTRRARFVWRAPA